METLLTSEEFFKNPLVVWVQTFRKDTPLKSLTEFADGHFLNEVMVEIDPTNFSMIRTHQVTNGDLNIRVQNLAEVVRNVKRFYQEKLQQLLVMRLPDLLAIAKQPESEDAMQELKKLLLLILGCAIQCEKKEYFIEKIKEQDVEVQRGLVAYIQEITENTDNVLTYRMSDVTELPPDQLVSLSETMYYQLQRLLEERDEYVEVILDLNLERHDVTPKQADDLRVRSPPMSPTRTGSIKQSVLRANKQRIRDLQSELEDRNAAMNELREEINTLKSTIDNMKQENKSLLSEARWAKTYRDEIDELKLQADKVNRLEGANVKFREKLRDLDFYKKRFEELKEQHELLYETKLVLEEQVAASAHKMERVGHLEDELERLNSQVKILLEQHDENQHRAQSLADENAKLLQEKQNCMAKIALLSAELDGQRNRSPEASAVPLSLEYKETSSLELLRLEKENKHLMKLVESLREGSPRIRELEKQNEELEKNLEEHKSTMEKLAEELSFERSKVGELAGVADTHVDRIRRLQTRLSQKSIKLESPTEVLARKGINNSQNGTTERRIKNINDLDGIDDIDSDFDAATYPETKAVQHFRKVVEERQQQVILLENEMKEMKLKHEKVAMETTQKQEEVSRLETRVKEHETFSAKVEQQLAQREKDISELERRFEKAVTENKSLNQAVCFKDDKITALEERISHLMDSASEDTRKVNKTLGEKLKQIRELETRMEELQDTVAERDQLKSSLKQKDEKVESLAKSTKEIETRLHDMELQYEKASSSCKQLEHSGKLKDERIKALEASLNETESSSSKQQSDRVSSLTKALDTKDQEINELEGKLDEYIGLNNKLKASNRSKDTKIQEFEDTIAEMEHNVKGVREEKVQSIMKQLKSKEEEAISMETKLEEITASLNKSQRTVDLKDEKIKQLEDSIQMLEESSHQSKKLSDVLEGKTKKIIELETKVQELKSENKRLQFSIDQKEERYRALEKSMVELENAVADKSSTSKLIKVKDQKISLLQQTVDDKEQRILEVENHLEEKDTLMKRISHTLKLREEKLHTMEARMEQLEDVEVQNTKLSKLLQQKDGKLLEMEDKVEQINEMQRLNERLKDNVKQKEDKIITLEERLHDLEEVVGSNERLNQHIQQKEERISVLQTRIHDLEDTVHRGDQLRDSLRKNAEEQIQSLRQQVDDLMDVKVKRQHSIRRREEKIMSLESRLDDISSDTRFKDTRIQELQSKISELQNTYKDNKKLNQLLKGRAMEVERLVAKHQEDQTSIKRLTDDLSTSEAKLSDLQQRLEETLSLNNKLDLGVKKQEEKVRELENVVQSQEDKIGVLSGQTSTKDRQVHRQNKRIEELEAAIMDREKDLSELELRLNSKVSDDAQFNRIKQQLKDKEFLVNNLQNRIKSLELSTVQEDSVLLKTCKESEEKIGTLQQRIEELSAEKHKMRLVVQEKEGTISELEKRIEEIQMTASETGKLSHVIKEKNNQLGMLKENVEHYQNEVLQLETRYDGVATELSRTKGSIRQKEGRISSLKSQLEDTVNKNHNLMKDLGLKSEKIKSLEKNLADSQSRQLQLKEELNNVETQMDELRKRLDQSGGTTTEKIQLTKRARSEATSQQGAFSEAQIKKFKDEIELLEKEKSHVIEQNDTLSSENASLQTENESLRSELDLLRNDYEIIHQDMSDAKERYKELDVSATKIAHRCEVLVQLNSTLEEENHALMDQVNKLLAQHQELLMRSLDSRDQYVEEERAFADRLYMLERQKEKLIEQVEAANKALSESAPPKKKNLFVRGAHKVLKKAGIKKKKEYKSATVQLVSMQLSPEHGSQSEASDSSFSPQQSKWSRDYSIDDSYIESTSMGPIQSVLSRSKQDLLSIDSGSPNTIPRSAVVLRRQGRMANDSPSSGSEKSGPTGRPRPKSGFVTAADYEGTPLRSNLYRPRSMEMLESAKMETDSFLSKAEEGREETSRRSSGFSNSSESQHSTTSRHSSGQAVAFGVVGYSETTNEADPLKSDQSSVSRDGQIQKVRVTEKVIPRSPQLHLRSGSNISQEYSDDAGEEIIAYADAKTILDTTADSQADPETSRRKVSFEQAIRNKPPTKDKRSISVTATPSTSTPQPNSNKPPVDFTTMKSSPQLHRTNIFYTPGNQPTPDELPESERRSSTGQRCRSESGSIFYAGTDKAAVENQLTRKPSTGAKIAIGSGVEARKRTPMDESRRKTVGGISTQEITSVTVRALDDSQARGGRISIQSRTIPEPDSKDKQSKDTNDNKKKTQEEGEQKKPSVWYEYGCV